VTTVIDLEEWKKDRAPHAEGAARCVLCGHEWHQVANVGEWQFECPQCGTLHGLFVYPVARPGLVWTCHCGSIVFSRSPDGWYCYACGREVSNED